MKDLATIPPFAFDPHSIATDKDDRVSLTDLWKAAGSNDDKRPNDWLALDQTKAFIEGVCSVLNTVQNGIISTKRGKSGGSFAHKQIALAYAKYLDPKLHVAVNEVFFQRIEEEKNPGLAIDRAVKTWEKKGKSQKWVQERMAGIATRNHFTKTLAAHKVTEKGFKDCTNAIYEPLWGGDASLVRQKKGLPEKANTRESMSEVELAGVRLAELLASENIERRKIEGNDNCATECKRTASHVAKSIIHSRGI